MNQKYEKLKALLMELFQLDQPDLDFGFYRVMHAKSAEVTQFLEKDLLPQVKAAFVEYKTADKVEIEKELAKATEQAHALGVDPESTQKVKVLRTKLADDAVDLEALEADVYDHLYSFFRRYYSEGDFLSKRVYKPGVYAIPYEGEEVKLYWANADQYYIKTSEYLRDYAFRLRPDNEKNPMRVHFRLVDAAEGEHGNVKEQAGKERRFMLAAESPVTLENGELVVRFTYLPDPAKQKELNAAAEHTILTVINPAHHEWIQALRQTHARADGTKSESTRLRVHLDRYTARNTFDYFIHKDLGGFLRRELDFYIKNEVMHLDDVENESAPRVEQYLSKIKVLRRIGGKVIEFLAQLEDFQRKLWVKKKFVVETSYCIRLGVIPEAFYAEIAGNDAQREEWVRLCAIDGISGDLTAPRYTTPLTSEFLKSMPALTLDTRFYAPAFVDRLLSAFPDMANVTDGVLANGENLQTCALLSARYRRTLNGVYADPPFNTAATEIAYKNEYKHSSWLAMALDRIRAAARLVETDRAICIAIDDAEVVRLVECLTSEFGEDNHVATIAVRSNPHGRAMAAGVSVNHEYAVFWGLSPHVQIGRLPRNEARMARYPDRDDRGAFTWINFRKTGADSRRVDRPKLYYPVYVAQDGRVRVPLLSWSELDGWVPQEAAPGETPVFPIDTDGTERVWTLGVERARLEASSELEARRANGAWQVYRKYRPNDEGALPGTWWDDAKYSATESGTKVLNDLFGTREVFSYPKSVYLVEDCLRVLSGGRQAIYLDPFAGSGTTGHAIIRLNREDGGRRGFVLIEAGSYFETVLLPRLQKVGFTPDWEGGKPKRLATPEEVERSPRIMKVIRLESYEDSLNNLELHRSEHQQALLDLASAKGPDKLREQYMLQYMLDVETRGSKSLLNVAAFIDPTAYKLKVKLPGSDESREVNVDLLETFNWLIGLTVRHIAAPRTFIALFTRDNDQDLPKDAPRRLVVDGRLKEDRSGPWWFRTITGTTPDGRNALIIWRSRPGAERAEGVEQDNLVLDEWFTKQRYSSKDSEFDLIYVNGTNNLENLKAPDDTWKVRLIEEDFHRLMFETDAI